MNEVAKVANLSNEIIIEERELRPCHVLGKRALFHCWWHVSQIHHALLCAAPGTISDTYGIVEYENGVIERVLPSDIQFLDSNRTFVKRIYF